MRNGMIHNRGQREPWASRRSKSLTIPAVVLNLVTANVYAKLFGIAIFGGIFVWIMIFVSFLRFRPRWAIAELPFRAPFYPYLPILGAATLTAILVTMLINPDWRFAWEAGVPFLVFLLIVYFIVYGLRRKEEVEPHERVGS
jgi:amino acid transporter, AAT family